jgi:glycerate dehydrogenase
MPKKIVVLDGYALNPGDLSWDGLHALGEVSIHPRTEPRAVMERAAGAEIVLINKTPLPAAVLRELPALRYIGVLATGYNCVDVRAAQELGIAVTNVPTYGTASVAQLTFALLLELCHNVKLHSDAVRAGEWARSKDWSFWVTPLIELAGKTMGIVGFGRIGRQVAAVASSLGMQVIACDPAQVGVMPDGVRRVSLEDLLREADVVSLHCPLTAENEGLIDARRLALMKPSAFLLNTSRGQLVNERDLSDALHEGAIAGAALDVLPVEPPSPENPLFTAPNCLITPHIAWATKEARTRLLATAVQNVQAFLNGTPQNIVTAP